MKQGDVLYAIGGVTVDQQEPMLPVVYVLDGVATLTEERLAQGCAYGSFSKKRGDVQYRSAGVVEGEDGRLFAVMIPGELPPGDHVMPILIDE